MKKINIKFLISCFLFFVIFNFSVNAVEIKGVVINTSYKPAKNVKVYLFENDNKLVDTITNKLGKFYFKIDIKKKNKYRLVFKSDDFFEYSLEINKIKKLNKIKVILIPKDRIVEEIVVTPFNSKGKFIQNPLSQSRISELEIKEKQSDNLVDTITESSSVYFIGKGGFNKTPSIRGLARRRVLILFDGARITSDRRVGASGSLVPMEFLEGIDILKATTSVLYGSDAIGGVINMRLSSENHENFMTFTSNYQTNNKEFNNSLVFRGKINKKISFYTGGKILNSDNYYSPEGEVYNSGYGLKSGIIQMNYNDSGKEMVLRYFGGFGKDMGKPDRDNNPLKYSFNPRMYDQFLQLKYKQKLNKANINFDFYYNPSLYELKKNDDLINKTTYSKYTSNNYGVKIYLTGDLFKSINYNFGIDIFNRKGLSVENREIKDDVETISYPIVDANRLDLALFGIFDYAFSKKGKLVFGLRYNLFDAKGITESFEKEINDSYTSLFVGINYGIFKNINFFINASTGYRMPSLSELFYTGVSGRKYVVGNSNLLSERSLNYETGLRFNTNKFYIEMSMFRYDIKDLIERFKNDEGIYTYDNIYSAYINGFELEFQGFLLNNLEVFGYYNYYIGRDSESKDYINDIPAPRLFLGVKLFINQFWFEINSLYSFEKDNPGPAEIENNDFLLINLKTGYYFSSKLFLYLRITNLFNTFYYPSADPDIPPAMGLSFSLGLNISI